MDFNGIKKKKKPKSKYIKNIKRKQLVETYSVQLQDG